jgi:hypothetical protein
MQPKLGTFTDFGSGTSTLAANLQDLADNGTAAFDRSTDSLQAIRDRGDAAWTGSGGSDPQGPAYTTIATAPTTTTVTLTAAPNDDTQLPGFGIYIENNGDADDYCLRKITGVASAVVTYDAACPFTVAAGDVVKLLPAFLNEGVDVTTIEGTDATDQLDAHAAAGLDAAGVRAAVGLNSANLDTQLATIDQNVDDIEVDTGTTLQAELDGIQADTEDIQSRIPAALVGGRIDATVDGTGMEAGAVTAIQSGLATAAALTTVDNEIATLQTSVDDLPTNAELATSQAAADDATLAAIAALNNLSAANVRDLVIEDQGGGVSLGCALAVVLAYAAGDLTTTTGDSVYEDPSGTETRAEGTVSTAGNRTVAITCPTY